MAGGPRQDRAGLVILVWASWAEASRPSLSTARELGRKHAPGIEVVAIDLAEETVRVPDAVLRLCAAREPARDADDGAMPGADGADRPPGEGTALSDVREGRAAESATSHGGETATGADAEVSTEVLLDRLGIDVVPTWIRAVVGEDGTAREIARREGARPKHEVETTLFRT